jgi:protease II
MGREWYLNGRMEHKINSFKDFINCGEFLKKIRIFLKTICNGRLCRRIAYGGSC